MRLFDHGSKSLFGSHGQPRTNAIESDADLFAFNLHLFEERTAIDQILFAIVLSQSPKGEPLADIPLVLGMDIPRLPNIGKIHGHRDASVRDGEGLELRHANLRPAIATRGIISRGKSSRQLDKVKGKVAFTPSRPPAPDQGAQLQVISFALIAIGFALIPDRPLNSITGQRMNLPVKEAMPS